MLGTENSTVGRRRGGRELESAEEALSCIDVLLGGCNATDPDCRRFRELGGFEKSVGLGVDEVLGNWERSGACCEAGAIFCSSLDGVSTRLFRVSRADKMSLSNASESSAAASIE